MVMYDDDTTLKIDEALRADFVSVSLPNGSMTQTPRLTFGCIKIRITRFIMPAILNRGWGHIVSLLS